MNGMIINKWSGERSAEPLCRKAAVIDEMNDPFARQKLVSWWDQDKIEGAKVFVAGAGAIGNEVLHNCALLGFRNIFICDIDTIELSNLSRTLLFGKADEGRRKAEIAAERTREMCLAEDPRVDFFCGDIMYELGNGVFRHFDIVLGCLDNDATRFYLDRQCAMFGKPWINAGISELSVSFQLIHYRQTGTCFHCGESHDVIARVMSRKASCGKTAIEDLRRGKIPTVQVASAIVAGMQVQEAVKYVCGKHVDWGRNYYYQGSNNTFEVSRTTPDENCMHHSFAAAENVFELTGISSRSTMRELLTEAKSALGIQGEIFVDLSEEHGRDYITDAYCIYCGDEVKIGTPRYRFRDEMAVCASCRAKADPGEASDPITNSIRCYGMDTEAEVLDLTLGQLGIPPLHVLRVYDGEDNAYFVEMTGDLPRLMPNIFGTKENADGT